MREHVHTHLPLSPQSILSLRKEWEVGGRKEGGGEGRGEEGRGREGMEEVIWRWEGGCEMEGGGRTGREGWEG